MLKQKLKNNELTLGSWVTIGHQSVIEIMASGGFDWLTIDMEHSVIELERAQQLIGHIQANGMEALVRVGENAPNIIKRVMDAGANGVIVPMVNSGSDAERAVKSVKYPPIGNRGVGLARAQNYGIGFDEYREKLEKEAVVIVQIEHIKAVENIEDIINTPGVDGMIIGPYDLSGSLGIPGQFDHKSVVDALKHVEKVCKDSKFPLGFHVVPSDNDLLVKKIEEGYRFLAFSIDFMFLGNKLRDEMKIIKEKIQ